MAGKKFPIHLKGKYRYKGKPRIGSYDMTDQRTGFKVNIDHVMRQWNGVLTVSDYIRPRHPHDYWPAIGDDLGGGVTGTNIATKPATVLNCLARDGNSNIIGVYQSTNQFTCEVATAAQVSSYKPSISNQTFLVLSPLVTDWYSVGTVVATDPNSYPLSYEITEGWVDSDGTNLTGDELFHIDPDTGELSIRNSSLLDIDNAPYSITVQVTNRGPHTTLTAEATITVNVQVWDPSFYGTVGVWVDMSNTDNITSSGGKVSAITDSSSAGIDLKQATSNNQPSLVTNGLNGVNTIQLNTSNDPGTQANDIFMSASDSTVADFKYLHDGTTAWSVVAVVKPEESQTLDAGTTGFLLSTGGDMSAGSEGVSLGWITSQKEADAQIHATAGANSTLLTTGDAITFDEWAVYTWVHVPDAPSGETVLYFYINGVLTQTATKTAVAYDTDNPDNVLYFGVDADTGNKRLIGEVADISIIKADIRTSIDDVVAAVQQQWGLS